MIKKIEEVLEKLIKREYKPDNGFRFDVDEYDESGGSSDEINFNIRGTDYWILSNFNWSYRMIEGMKGDYLTPDDRNEFILDDLEVENFEFGEGEEEYKINLRENPSIKKLFSKYLISLWENQQGEVDKSVLKMTKESSSIKKFNQFLLEWGYGGEGGVPSKDPVKASSKMITEIDLKDGEEEEEEDKDIPVLNDINEWMDYNTDEYEDVTEDNIEVGMELWLKVGDEMKYQGTITSFDGDLILIKSPWDEKIKMPTGKFLRFGFKVKL